MLLEQLRYTMSRSYKRTPIIKYCGNSRFGKRQSSKKVRKSDRKLLLKGSQYKRLFETWNINDIVQFYSLKEAEKRGNIEHWKKYFYRK